MSAADRHRTIESQIASEGRVAVSDLAVELAVTEETIRRDLRVLESQGKLAREHGGAVHPASNPLPWLAKRSTADIDQQLIERMLVEIPNEGVVFLGGGQMAERLLLALPEECRVTLVTPSIDVAMASTEHPNIETYSLGGHLSSASGTISGDWAQQTLARLRIDVAVFTAEAGVPDGEVGAPPGLAALQTEVMARSERNVLVVQEGEREHTDFVVYATVEDFDTVIR